MKDDIHAIQTDFFNEFKKYRKFDYEDYKVHEYMGPLGAGYIIFSFRDSEVMAEDFGPEQRSFDWRTYG